jgi:hypothetical protein
MPTPLRAIRIPDELWTAAHAAADEDGEYLSDVIRRALTRYVLRAERKRFVRQEGASK